jgi:DNA-binding NarL/FixJ family response regulator
MPIRVAIVEDDPLTRKGLAMHVNRASNLQCVGCYENTEDAEREIPQLLPDVVLMDINLHGRSGIGCVGRLKQSHPQIQFLILSTYDDSELVFAALRAGADGYLLKRTRPAQLLKAIEEVRAGGVPMSSNIARLVVTHFHQPKPTVDDMQKLTRREREVLDQLAEGFGYGEIAEHLGITMGTMNNHVKAIYRKLQVQTRADAVLKLLHR